MGDSELDFLRSGSTDEIEANRAASSDERLKSLASPERVAKVMSALKSDGSTKTLIKAKKSDWIRALIHLDGTNFDFSGRDYLKQIYDTKHPHKLLVTGRQVEKCQPIWSTIHRSDGGECRIDELRLGDSICAMNQGGIQTQDLVLASESNGVKKCLRIKTRLGSTIEATLNHPFRKLLTWEQASKLIVGDKIAALRSVGFFGDKQNDLAMVVGLLFGDGSFSNRLISLACGRAPIQELFEKEYIRLEGIAPKFSLSKGSKTQRTYRVSVSTKIAAWFYEHDLIGMVASIKKLPAEVFSYNKESTRNLIRGLWATDGHCKNVTSSKIDLVYCSTSETLVRQVRLLLRKFGVLTTLRTYKPQRGQKAFLIRVVTRKSIEAFHRDIGPIPGKPFNIPGCESNSNLDTVPREVLNVLKKAKRAAGYGGRWGSDNKCFERDSGFRFKSNYCPTFEKLAAAQSLLNNSTIQKILDSDIIWDEIVSIEDLGDQPTWSIQTQTETYISDFIVQHNSTMLANEIIINSVVIPYFKTLYVSPSHDQTRQFSNGKLKPWIEDSPLIQKYFQNSAVSKQVFEKSMSNGSIAFLRSAFLSADRTRGISSDILCLDEIQDILTSNIPVITETLSHSKYGYKIFAGTPKTLENPIQQYFEMSSMCEWLIPCFAHSPPHWNYIDEKSIGKDGPICNKCGKPINPAEGKWIAFNDSRDILGFRISQIMVPWIYQNPLKWKEFLWKYENLSRGIFYNECLGISFDSASKPITRTELVECCSSKHPLRYHPDSFTHKIDLFAGVDYGEGSDGTERGMKGRMKNASYTVLTIGVYLDPTHFHYLFMKRYTGEEALPANCIGDIINIARAFRVKCVGADWGHGWGVNEQLETALGKSRVIKFQYVGNQRERKKFDEIGLKYQLGRTEVMTDFFTAIKNHHIIFPAWESVKDYLCDIEHVYAEYGDGGRSLKYDHKPSEPDDALHSMIYCKEAADNYFGKHK
jgi:intein/homing endonuclease